MIQPQGVLIHSVLVGIAHLTCLCPESTKVARNRAAAPCVLESAGGKARPALVIRLQLWAIQGFSNQSHRKLEAALQNGGEDLNRPPGWLLVKQKQKTRGCRQASAHRKIRRIQEMEWSALLFLQQLSLAACTLAASVLVETLGTLHGRLNPGILLHLLFDLVNSVRED